MNQLARNSRLRAERRRRIISHRKSPTILGANFDGSNDYLTRDADLTGISDGIAGTFAMRIRKSVDGTAQQLIASDNNRFRVVLASNDKIDILAADTSGSTLLRLQSSAISASSNYIQILISWNMAATPAHHLYIDDSSDKTILNSTAGTIDYTATGWGVGATSGGGQKFNGDATFMYFDTVYHDFSQESNRRLFFDASGNPVLDPTGNGTPSGGSQPLVYLAGKNTVWHTNKGTGGGFTENGELTQPSS